MLSGILTNRCGATLALNQAAPAKRMRDQHACLSNLDFMPVPNVAVAYALATTTRLTRIRTRLRRGVIWQKGVKNVLAALNKQRI